jgi:hypothetical protein
LVAEPNTSDKNRRLTAPAKDPLTGKFVKGNKGGPGRPPIAFSPTAIIRARVEERPAVIDKLFEAADKGEAWAITYIIDRIEGKPKQSVEAEHSGTLDVAFKWADGSEA